MFPTLPTDPEATPVENAQQRQQLYHRCWAVLLVILEECARRGIKVTHRSPPLPLYMSSYRSRENMPVICPSICLYIHGAYAWHMPMQRSWHVAPVAPLLAVPHGPG